MCDCFHFAFVQHQGSFYQRFAVTGGTGRYDMCIFRKLFIDFFDSDDGSSQRTSVVAAVEGVQ